MLVAKLSSGEEVESDHAPSSRKEGEGKEGGDWGEEDEVGSC